MTVAEVCSSHHYLIAFLLLVLSLICFESSVFVFASDSCDSLSCMTTDVSLVVVTIAITISTASVYWAAASSSCT